ncbi:exopolysaccharide biosynthesis polyprenyl glycosylphosphotransferase [Blastococcus sp. VKM Ac-2987]|uniref:exopolysaccharide biosynthesis polyprenyl glycosylphosphotransferase n=1 Tax=Blastococcus sp. VKM Ac-2987 TaxID=3004141 RepID=UPI0022AB9593|nr:exopolysaccharide biosynthesis polyprenyl glycosylphosphotransferase [Blastococcus sp. VKM Ac-2987]MCZ2860741.1 exopolysaccharide biosynthesis polyprenyl glycosylphosphotransferase [Blastococcus sp. VKM Ac-2987]
MALIGADLVALSLPVLWLGGPVAPAAAYVAVAVALLAVAGAYRPRITLGALQQAPHDVLRLGFALLLVAPFVLPGTSSSTLPLQALVSLPALLSGRAIGYAAIRWARWRGLVGEATLVVGGGKLGMGLLRTMDEHPELGLRAVGFLGDGDRLDDRKPLGTLADVDAVLDANAVRKVVVAYGPTREADLVGLVRSAAMRDVEVYVVPRFFDVGMTPNGPEVEDLWGIPLHRVRRAALRRGGWRAKRLLDVLVSGAALILLSPLLAVLALAVRLSSPGPVLFRQRRTGQFGAEIAMLKFRSLRVAPCEPAAADPSGTARSTMHARRVDVELRATPIGALLRRTSLDELPQLWNIFRGDMSLVGPRPEECGYAAQFADSVHGYRDRHRLAVGLTGWAQVHGLRGDTSIEERARFDNHYIEHWGLWQDVVILVRTASAVMRQALGAARMSTGR